MKILRAADHTTMPWANGGGTTHEVARDGSGSDFTWRISFAEVTEPGPFSSLPGLDRIITLVRGDGLNLTLTDDDGRTTQHQLEVGEPYAFPGEAEVFGRPAGDTVDLNLMTRRGTAHGDVVVTQLGSASTTINPSSARTYVAVLTGTATVTSPDQAEHCGSLDVVELGEDPAVFTGDALIATVRIEPATAAPSAERSS